MSHSHTFRSWHFALPVETGMFTTRQALDDTEPVREVYHEHDGDWQFLCGTTIDETDVKLVCLGCMVEADHTIGELADLPAGWRATRQALGDAWSRAPYEDEDEDE
ncbi:MULTISPECIES: hypothetical protein [unclassified Xanthomonas]|uniref:hypothetical protein n=1 Tax=Xanthomonas sp. LMG 9002 TaxID=1591158 RepID=UPI00136EDC5B|nr:hypothetical protein [Xanthomonas sp. LMG 9002]MXV05666.1 hypothetical protein [Xanthomonas sp. LMG 9002]